MPIKGNFKASPRLIIKAYKETELTVPEIAVEYGVSYRTVERYVSAAGLAYSRQERPRVIGKAWDQTWSGSGAARRDAGRRQSATRAPLRLAGRR